MRASAVDSVLFDFYAAREMRDTSMVLSKARL